MYSFDDSFAYKLSSSSRCQEQDEDFELLRNTCQERRRGYSEWSKLTI